MNSQHQHITQSVFRLFTIVLLVLFSLSACGEPEVATVKVTPEEKTLLKGESFSFQASALSSKGKVLAPETFQWSVEGEAGSIDSSGKFTAQKPGQAVVVARANGVTGKSQVTVEAPPPVLGKIQLTPEDKALTVGEVFAFQAKAFSTEDEEMPDATIQWSVEGDAGSVNENGLFTAEKAGKAVVVAKAKDVTTQSRVTVTPPKPAEIKLTPTEQSVRVGETFVFSAVVMSNLGKEMPGVAVQWSVEGDAGSVSDKGEFTAKKPGSAEVVAQVAGLLARGAVTVNPKQAAKIEVSPEKDRGLRGQTVNVSIKVLGEDGKGAGYNEINISSPTEGLVISSRRLMADAEGHAQVEVTLSGRAGANQVVFQSGGAKAELDIEGTTITRLAIRPEEDEYEAGQPVTFKAWGQDDFDNELPVTVVWSLTGEAEEIADLSDDGTVKMIKPGSGILMAEYEGLVTGRSFQVVPGEFARIKLTPERVHLKAGENVTFKAESFNAFGYPITVTLDWEVKGNVGTITEGGFFFAEKQGVGAVVAYKGDISAEVPVEVQHAYLANILFELPQEKVVAGDTIKLFAEGIDAFGNRFSVSPEWYLSKSIGEINKDEATFTARYSGHGEIRAMVESIMKSRPVEVVPAELVRLSIAPATVNVLAGESVQFEVQGLDRFGNLVDVQPAYSIRDQLGTLSTTGLFEARKAGNTFVTAEVEGLSIESAVTVVPSEMVRVAIQPGGSIELTAGKAQQFNASGLDAFDNTVSSETKWQVLPDLGTLDPSGNFIPKKAAKGKVHAAVREIKTGNVMEAEVVVSVSPGETARITIEPSQVQILAGREQTFSARAYDEMNNETGVPLNWSLMGLHLGTISSEGLFKARRAGSAKVRASYQSVVATADVEVVPAEIAFLKIIPESLSLAAGQEMQLQAVGEDRFGNFIYPKIIWTLTDPELAAVTPEGDLLAKKSGKGHVLATSKNIVEKAPLAVEQSELAILKIQPEEAVVAAGESVKFQVRAYDAGGNELPVSPAWLVDERLGEIDQNGVFAALIAGSGEIVVASGKVQGKAKIEVVPGHPKKVTIEPEKISVAAGQTVQLSFQVTDAHGNRITEPPYQWEVTDRLGWIGRDDVFHAVKAALGNIRLISGDASAEIPVAVDPGPLHRIDVQPDVLETTAGLHTGFSAKGFDAQGNGVELDPDWSVTDGIGTIDEEGGFQAVVTGNGYVAAQVGTVTGVCPVTVGPGPAVKVLVEPEEVTIAAGRSVAFHATAYDSSGNVTPAQFTWALAENEEFGTINAEGVFSALHVGEGLIQAGFNQVFGTVRVSVVVGPLVRLSISPEAISLAAGEKIRLTVQGHDDFGNQKPVSPEFALDPQTLGTIDQDGVFVGQMAGAGILGAKLDGLETSAQIEVRPSELASIQIIAPKEKIEAGKTYQFEAVGYDRYGNEVPLENSWAVTQKIGKVELTSGRFHAMKTGTGIIMAYSEGVAAHKTVSVNPGDLYTLFVRPNPVTVHSDEIQEFTVEGIDVEKNEVSVSVSAVEWNAVGDIGLFDGPGVFHATKMGKGQVTAAVGDLLAQSYVTVVPGKADMENSRIRVTHPMLPADGKTYSTVLIDVRDRHNNPVPNVPVNIVSNQASDNILQPPKTGETGQTRGQVSSRVKGTSILSVVIDGRTIKDSSEVIFR